MQQGPHLIQRKIVLRAGPNEQLISIDRLGIHWRRSVQPLLWSHYLSPLPPKAPRLFVAKLQQVEETVGALDMSENVANIGAARQ